MQNQHKTSTFLALLPGGTCTDKCLRQPPLLQVLTLLPNRPNHMQNQHISSTSPRGGAYSYSYCLIH